MNTQAQLERAGREAIGLLIYRWLVNFALFVCGFAAFPDHKAVFALAVIGFSLGVATIVQAQNLSRAAENRLMDVAERKTRHTIVLAQERGLRGQTCDDYEFWEEIDARVETEVGAPNAPAPWWLTGGLIIWNTLAYLLGDLALVGLALLLSRSL